jgi:Arc/MetJ family transcription regulator
MVRRTTIELDQDLVARAKKALGAKTTRETVEEALRRAVQTAEGDRTRRATEQRAYLHRLGVHADIKVLNSEEMWR